jgi:hypothetical protein
MVTGSFLSARSGGSAPDSDFVLRYDPGAEQQSVRIATSPGPRRRPRDREARRVDPLRPQHTSHGPHRATGPAVFR